MAPRAARLLLVVLAFACSSSGLVRLDSIPQPAASDTAQLELPRKQGSVRFAVIGDTGRGTREQYEVASQMAAFHTQFDFGFVIMVGDNIYGSDAPGDMRLKFEDPYKALLDDGVKFHAALGNHDNPNQRNYKLFSMDGQRYYTFREGGKDNGARFFAIDSNYLDPEQLKWLEGELQKPTSDWKIAFFHHPLYSSGKTHGSSLEARAVLEPLFVKYGVNAVFSGHDHFYERTKPQKGDIIYWVTGGGGSLRKGDIRKTDLTAKGFDQDYSFVLVEVSGDDLYYQAISRKGTTVDNGVFHRAGGAAKPEKQGQPASPVPKPKVAPGGRTTPEGPDTGKPAPSPSPSPTAPPRL